MVPNNSSNKITGVRANLPEANRRLRALINEPPFSTMIDTLWEIVKSSQDAQTGITGQGHQHCLRVEENIWRILEKAKATKKLKPRDWFILSASAALHDIGKIAEKKDHGEEAKKIILKDGEKLVPNQPTKLEAVARIVGVHNSRRLSDDKALPKELPDGAGPRIPLRSLAAIFCLADMLDSDYNRCPYLMESFKESRLPEGIMPWSKDANPFITWIARKSIAGWDFSSDSKAIIFYAFPRIGKEDEIRILAYLDSLNASVTEDLRRNLENCDLYKETIHLPFHFVLEIDKKTYEGLRSLFEVVARKYALKVAEIYEKIQLEGMGDFSEKWSVTLSKVFINVNVARDLHYWPKNWESFDPLVVAKVQISLVGPDKKIPVTELTNIDKLKRIMLLGEPGSGKTTISKYLCYDYSKRISSRNGSLANQETIEGIPFLVTVRNFASRKKEIGLGLIGYLGDYVKSYLRLSGVETPSKFVEYWLSREGTFVIFDGMDEVPSPEDRNEIRKEIEELANDFPEASYIVTSRYAGYDETPFDTNVFLHLGLSELDGSQRDTHVRNWYEERVTEPDVRKPRIESFNEALEEPRVGELAKNPMLLDIMLIIHGAEAYLPKQRALLYKKCVEVLMHREIAKGQRAYDLEESKICHNLLGYTMHLKAATSKEGSSEMNRDELQLLLMQILENQDKVSKFIEISRGRFGLLTEREGLWSFKHRSFEEYFAALYISNKFFDIEKLWFEVKDKIGNPHWEEVLKLLAGIYNDTNQEALCELVNRMLREDLPQDPSRRGLLLAGGIVGDRVNFKNCPEIPPKVTQNIIKVFLETKDSKLMNRCKMVMGHLFNTSVEELMTKTILETDPIWYRTSAFQEIYRGGKAGNTRIERLIGIMGIRRK